MKLSVMVISHNQAHLIRRCLDSILAQKIAAPWEIVISDDASTDDTWDVIQEYVRQYPESKRREDNFVPRIRAYQINSSDYDPTVTSDRCAANKVNVYMHAEGEYCVNMDADDYLLGDDIYQYQINQLEAHPECAVAVQNIWYLNDGEPIEKGHAWHPKNKWEENEVITIEEFFQRRAFISNPAFMMRRDAELKPMEKYGLLFDDPVITMHHITSGMIICSRKAQYVYVQYPNSIWNQVTTSRDDAFVRELCPIIVELRFFPEKTNVILRARLSTIVMIFRNYLQKKSQIKVSQATVQYIHRLNNVLLNGMLDRTVKCRIKVWTLLQYARCLNRGRGENHIFWEMFKRMLLR